ncbi:MAG: twin-arginine translocation signal domain-containing protein, partial [Pseudomonadota bacterium]
MSANIKDLLTGDDKIEPVISRRGFMKGGACASAAFAALAARSASGANLAPQLTGYGPLAPVADDVTGLELLNLPEGFSYSTFHWTGSINFD